MSEHTDHKPQVVVVGAGFGGLEVARSLRKAPVDVHLIDKNNFHTFQPLLYQVATAGLEPGDIAHAVRNVLHDHKSCYFRMGTVSNVDRNAQLVELSDGGKIPYDFLVLAAGASNNDFGIEGVAEYSFPMKTLEDAVALRNHILDMFESANKNPEYIDDGMLNFVIVGGGPTGVEVSGSLSELFTKVLRYDYPDLDLSRARIILIEMASGLLNTYDDALQAYSERTLTQKGVEVRLESAVVHVDADAITLKTGEVIPTRTMIWAAGIQAHPLAKVLGFEQTRGGRMVVNKDLRIPNADNIFVIGDMAASTDSNGRLHPQVASTAIQGGRHVARQILHLLKDLPTKPFVYKDLGQMATIGRNAAVVQLPSGFKMKGWIAWIAWLFLHLVKLIGFRNRLSVMLNWIWNYFTYDRSARLIFGKTEFRPAFLPDQSIIVERSDEAIPSGMARHESARSFRFTGLLSVDTIGRDIHGHDSGQDGWDGIDHEIGGHS